MATISPTAREYLPDRFTLLVGTAVVSAELLVLMAYFVATGATVTDPRYSLYGLLWVNAGAWVLLRTAVPAADDSTRTRALAVGVGYFAVLAWTGGLVGAGVSATHASGLSLVWLPPGWGPALIYRGTALSLVLMPAKVVGYVALAYLVYATVVDAAGAAVSGVLGLFSCVSCSWPILASIASTLLGGGSFVAAATLTYSYDLSTLVFLVTVVLLSWRPLLR